MSVSSSPALRAGRLAMAAALLLVWLGFASHAAAELPRMHLTWSQPPASMCPSRAVVEADVAALEDRQVFVAEEDADVLVHGLVEDRPSGATVRLEARTAEGALLGTRVLGAPAGECASLRRAVALVLTMLLDDAATQHAAPRVRRGVPWQLGGGLALLSGSLPRVRPGVELALGVELAARLRARLDAAYFLPLAIESRRGVGASVQAYGASLSLCPRLSPAARPWALWLCAGTQLGGITASPRKLSGPAHQTRLLAQLLLELRLSLHVSKRHALELSAGPLLSLHRPELWYARADGSRADVARPALFGAIVRLTFIIDGH